MALSPDQVPDPGIACLPRGRKRRQIAQMNQLAGTSEGAFRSSCVGSSQIRERMRTLAGRTDCFDAGFWTRPVPPMGGDRLPRVAGSVPAQCECLVVGHDRLPPAAFRIMDHSCFWIFGRRASPGRSPGAFCQFPGSAGRVHGCRLLTEERQESDCHSSFFVGSFIAAKHVPEDKRNDAHQHLPGILDGKTGLHMVGPDKNNSHSRKAQHDNKSRYIS